MTSRPDDLGLVHVYEPPARAEAPTLLLLHGTGGDEHDLVPIATLLVPDAGILSPRGAVNEHGMPRFFRRLAPGVFDMDDLARRSDDLLRFIDNASRAYGFDRSRVIAAGLSNGANIAAHLLLSHGRALDAAVLFRAMPTRTDTVPGIAGGVDVYMNSGRHDRMIAPTTAEQLAELLRTAGAAVTLEWDESGHELTRGAVDSAREWLQRRRHAAER